jgi:predicted metal-dependent peptidase
MSINVLSHRLRASQLQTYKPKPDEEKFVREPIAFLVIKSPFFAHLLYQKCHISYTTQVPVAATDGITLFFNVAEMKRLGWTIANVAFVVGHEVLHVMYGDNYLLQKWTQDKFIICRNGRKLDFHNGIAQHAMDYRNNAMLVEAKVGSMPQQGLYNPHYSKAGFESVVDIYEKIYDETPPSERDKFGNDPFDILMEPPPGLKEEIESGAMTQAVAAAVAAAEASGQGTLPGAIKRLLGELLDPKISWEDKLQSMIVRHVGDPLYDWRRLDKRLLVRSPQMYFAPTAPFGCGTVAICVDTSGSITEKIFNVFFGVMNGICRDLNPEKLIVLWCDADIGRVDDLDDPEDLLELHEDVNRNGVNGGGGTDFRPPFKWMDEQGVQPEIMIYLTDTYGTFPDKEPDYPVVWAIINGATGKSRLPWGDCVEVEVDE